MTCGKYRDLMAAAAMGEIGRTERADFEAHLASCDRCRAEFARLQKICGILSDDNSGHMDELDRLRLENGVYRELAGASSVRPGRSATVRLLIRVAAGLVLVGLGYATYPLLSRSDKPAGETAPGVAGPALAAYDSELAGSRRFTAAGFKVIAHGRAAAAEIWKQEAAAPAQPQ